MGWPSWLKGGSSPVIVATTKGQVEGFQDKGTGVFHFRGIPYAAPPVGALRFKKPQPHPAWDGVRSCKEFGKTAVQVCRCVVCVGQGWCGGVEGHTTARDRPIPQSHGTQDIYI